MASIKQGYLFTVIYLSYATPVKESGWNLLIYFGKFSRPGQLGRYNDPLQAVASADRIPVWDEIHTSADRSFSPPSLVSNKYRVIPGGKAAGVWS